MAQEKPDAVWIALHGGAGEDGAVRAVLDSPVEARRTARRARVILERDFSWSAAAEYTAAIYRAVTSGRP